MDGMRWSKTDNELINCMAGRWVHGIHSTVLLTFAHISGEALSVVYFIKHIGDIFSKMYFFTYNCVIIIYNV